MNRLVDPLENAMYVVPGAWNRLGIKYVSNRLPFFVRGMALVNDRLLVGLSPATILEIDITTGTLIGTR